MALPWLPVEKVPWWVQPEPPPMSATPGPPQAETVPLFTVREPGSAVLVPEAVGSWALPPMPAAPRPPVAVRLPGPWMVRSAPSGR